MPDLKIKEKIQENLERLQKLNLKDQLSVLQYGFRVRNQMKIIGSEEINAQLQDKIQSLEQELKDSIQDYKDLEYQHRRQIDEKQRQVEETFSNQVKIKTEEIQSLKRQLQDLNCELSRQQKEHSSQIVASASKHISKVQEETKMIFRGELDRTLERNRLLEEQLKMERSRIDELTERMTLVSKSQKKGEQGEMRIIDLLNMGLAKDGWQIIDTSQEGGKADIHVLSKDEKASTSVACEVKNYTKTISSAEVEKFKRDISQLSYGSGIFISTGSSIARISDQEIRWFKNKDGYLIPVIFLIGSDHMESICYWVKMMSKIGDMLICQQADSQSYTENNIELVEKLILRMIDTVNDMKHKMKAIRISVNEQTKQTEDSADKILNMIVETAGCLSIKVETTTQKKQAFDTKVMYPEFSNRLFTGDTIINYLKQKGCTDTKAKEIRKNTFEFIGPKDVRYAPNIKDLPSGKKYWILKQEFQQTTPPS